MRRITMGLAAAAAMMMATAAQATVSITGTTGVTTSNLQNLTAQSGSFQFGSNSLAMGSFTDSLTFHNDLADLYNLTVQTLNGVSLVNFGCDGCGIFLSGTGIVSPIQLGVTGLNQFGNTVNLGAGDFTLTFKGFATTAAANFNGIVDWSAVPEPATWAMMLLGFAAIGASVRRRKLGVPLPQLA